MNDFRAGAKLANGVCHAIVEARPNSENEIAVVHRHIGLIEPMHAQHAQKLLVRAGVGTQSHQRIGDRVIQLPCQPCEQLGPTSLDNPAARVNHRPLGREQ